MGNKYWCVKSYNFTLLTKMLSPSPNFKDGWCNLCGCRDGVLYCTKIPICRYEDGVLEEQDISCEECNFVTPRRSVCAGGQTFPTSCHATQCQGLAGGQQNQLCEVSLTFVGLTKINA